MNYIEQIKVGENESWKIRDRELTDKVGNWTNAKTMTETITEHDTSLSTLSESNATIATTVTTLNSSVEEIKADLKNYLPLEGGTITGPLCFGEDVVGHELPEASMKGRIFLKIVETAGEVTD